MDSPRSDPQNDITKNNDKSLFFALLSDDKLIRLTCILVLVTSLCASGALFYAYGSPISPTWLALANMHVLVAITLSVLYFIYYRIHKDTFYLFLSLAWLTNAIYVFSEAFFPRGEIGIQFYATARFLANIHYIILYFASYIPIRGFPSYSKFVLGMVRWVIQIAAALIVAQWIIINWWPSPDLWTRIIIFSIATLPFHIWASIRVGQALKSRLDTSVYGNWASILPISFYSYGLSHPLFFFRLIFPSGMILFLLITLFIKLLNGLAVLSIIRREFDNMQERVIQQDVLKKLGGLTAGLEHDVRTPLGFINMEIDRMRQTFRSNTDVLAGLERISEQTNRIFASTQIIALLRESKEVHERSLERISIRSVIIDSVRIVGEELDTSRVNFKIHDSEEVYAKANRLMLERVFVNILKNAVEAIQEATRETGTINISLNSSPQHIPMARIDIIDNGCGIEEEYISKLTTLFTTKMHKRANSGLGLFIATEVISRHGGGLEIKSKKGEGTTVSVLIPKL